MDPFQILMPLISQLIGVEPATLLLYITMVITIANLLGRAIPDDKTGVLGVVRDVCKVLGLYLSNRVSSGVTTNDVAKHTLGIELPEKKIDAINAAASEPQAMVPEIIETVAESHLAKSPFRPRPPEEGYVRVGTLLLFAALLVFIILLASGCTTTQVTERICQNREAILAAAQATINALNQCPTGF